MTLARKFHEAFGLPAPGDPPLRPSAALVRHRTRLLRDEFERTVKELGHLARVTDPNRAREGYRAVLTRLATLRYAVDGAAVSLGLDIDRAVFEVHCEHLRTSREAARVADPDLTHLVPDIIDSQEVP